MLQVPQRPALSGPALVRLLAGLSGIDAAAPTESLANQLSQWLGWTEAIALSSALQGPAGGARTLASVANDPAQREARECARVRTALATAIAGETGAGSQRRGPGRPAAIAAAIDAAVDYSVYQQRYQHLQQTMEAAIRPLRTRLRAALSVRPGMAQLAAVDAVMERVLSQREQSLMAGVPALLQPHFERLRQAEALAQQSDAADTAARPGAWLRTFREDMQRVLMAELEIRFQPVEGLLAALRGG
ncbi:DUF3348 domain-containing protein [Cupriavidus sp. AU9028]|uniref:DUF3348 domain-containing protein n=1 Tax=Cupriavidus sp. AU9028 TaxID=2871157 RepID=UPI001C98629F|nr:DUF3348 domain-containing protein [Cupriavidus sp. AU9028]MBY4895928.1 DUF3348 domain-containing protein [Cupriavidus sp. AU9028]